MKKYIIVALALALNMTARAQVTAADLINIHLEMDEPNGQDHLLRLGVYIDNTSNSLQNQWYDPTIYLNALSFDLDLPVPMYVDNVVKDGMATPYHDIWPTQDCRYLNRYFICCFPTGGVGSFYGLQGRAFTLILNPGWLNEGEYDIYVDNISMVETNLYKVIDYDTKPGFSYRFVMRDGVPETPLPTEIKGVDDKDSRPVISGPQGIYTLQGVKVEKTQPGNIYIINGKKVMK